MSNNKNHHFVPQYYFRNFIQENNSLNKKIINMLIKKDGNVKKNVSIKDQASKNNFYLNKNLEKIYSDLERKHCNLLNTINNIDSIEDYKKKYNNLILIFQATIFQYLRTLGMLNRIKSMFEDSITGYKELFIRNSTEITNLIQEEGLDVNSTKENLIKGFKINFHNKYFNHYLNSEIIPQTFIFQEAIKDLKIYILNNKTNKEFIFSDNPVIFYNLAFYNIEYNSMTAIQSPGLMIFFPISSKKCILLLDREKYKGSLIKKYFFDIQNEIDIDTINKLQIHNSTNSIYFSDIKNEEYVRNLYIEEKNNLKFFTKDVRVDGNKIISIPEKVNYKINLSFISPKNKINDFPLKYRNKGLYKIMKIGNNVLKFMKKEANDYKKMKEELSEPCDINEIKNIINNKFKNMNGYDFSE